MLISGHAIGGEIVVRRQAVETKPSDPRQKPSVSERRQRDDVSVSAAGQRVSRKSKAAAPSCKEMITSGEMLRRWSPFLRSGVDEDVKDDTADSEDKTRGTSKTGPQAARPIFVGDSEAESVGRRLDVVALMTQEERAGVRACVRCAEKQTGSARVSPRTNVK